MDAGVVAGQVAARLAQVRSRIADAGGTDVAVLAVTKGFGPEAVAAARSAGLADLGENYAQELLAKAEAATDPPPRWHAIGRLQRNKVRQLAPHVWCWQSVDRTELAAEIARRAPGARVLVQVAAWGERQKGGAAPADVPALVEACRAGGLDVRGLMAVAPGGGGAVASRGFAAVRSLADDLDLAECSMGMSDDLVEAVAEGSTMVRVGRGLFGPRSSAPAVGN
jgi:pyridoxal phosphate enzyme (YggS family)